jgi:hypothetical protein
MKGLFLCVATFLAICASIRLGVDVATRYDQREATTRCAYSADVAKVQRIGTAAETMNQLEQNKTLRGTNENKANNESTKQEKIVQCQSMARNKNTTTSLKPVLIAGYPGSGNDLSRTIVEKLTGFDGNDIYTENGNCSVAQRAATCKTHYPIISTFPPEAIRDSFGPSAAFLIRNPAKAIPSFFNFVWEFEHELAGHSQQAPEHEWIQWRDISFGEQIELWYHMIVYWFDHWYVQTVLPYERLTDPDEGPLVLQQLARQLESSGFHVATDYTCQWYDCVVQSAKVKRAPHAYVPAFTSAQKMKMVRVVQQASEHFAHHSVLAPVLQQYIIDIEQHVRVVDQE